ncbi:hypothetical protein JTE90_008223 [Oedothorax gibbosus]|uniref:Uncharacterized protein n=1 Tax=Oedothorax gibbosus TaxID=931172 RepID=A0AAV6U0S4_9ARAC|nr:hypothetical protein JTE90_008223 [Oedothorax gibbosus]
MQLHSCNKKEPHSIKEEEGNKPSLSGNLKTLPQQVSSGSKKGASCCESRWKMLENGCGRSYPSPTLVFIDRDSSLAFSTPQLIGKFTL